MSNDAGKQRAALAALKYIEEDTIIGVGTGSTVNFFIDALAAQKLRIRGAVSSSNASTERLRGHGIEIFELNAVGDIDVYVDGADECDPHLRLIKGGGAALTRAYVEQDLADIYEGEVRYARDAFEGLRLMDAVMAVKRGDEGAALPERRERRVRTSARGGDVDPDQPIPRSDVATDAPIPTPPFWGDRIVKGIALADYAQYLDERATFLGQWGLKAARGGGPSYEELVETEGRPRLRAWLNRVQSEGLLEAAVVYGYFPCWAEGEDIVVAHHEGPLQGQERVRFHFPRQRRGRHLCLADYIRPREAGELDVIGFHVVTMGSRISEACAELFAQDSYRDYLELHGLSVQLTEALAEYWHVRVRDELGISAGDAPELAGILKQGYQGERYSFGYPACPDLEQQTGLFELLRPERVGVELSEEFQLHPEQSTSALILHHPEATYFNAT